jgi:hypothetical protein
MNKEVTKVTKMTRVPKMAFFTLDTLAHLKL